MTLIEIATLIDQFDSDLVIYAKRHDGRWSFTSEVWLGAGPYLGSESNPSEGFENLLEVTLAKEVIEVWAEWRGHHATPEEAVEALLYYALYDAYLPIDRSEHV